jgi:hypothetical protein
MDPRTFLAGTCTILLAAPLAVDAQQARKVYRIAFVGAVLLLVGAGAGESDREARGGSAWLWSG